MMKPRLPITLFLIVLSFYACSTNRAIVGTPAQSGASGESNYLIEKIGYDNTGLPLTNNKLAQRPQEIGSRFSVVDVVNGRPKRIYDIVVADESREEFKNPIYTMYEWTGKGFAWGKDVSMEVLKTPAYAVHSAPIFVISASVPLAVGTVGGFVGGFVVGVVDTSKALAKQAGVNLEIREKVTSVTYLEYDDFDRLERMAMSTPNGEVLVETRYQYDGESRTPSETIVKSIPEGITKKIVVTN